MKLKPISNRLLVEAVEQEKVTKSGIVLPDTAEKKKQMVGTVVATGPGKMNEDGDGRIPMSVKEGDKVLFKEPWGEENKIQEADKKLYLIDEDDVLAIVED